MSKTDNEMDFARDLARRGRLIEGGWKGFRAEVIPAIATPEQIKEMRLAFFSGVQFLFSTLMQSAGEDRDTDDEDLAMLSAIRQELDAFLVEFTARAAHDSATQGH